MLTWNNEDNHLDAIFGTREMEAYIPNESTTRKYYVYGLKMAQVRPHIGILLGNSANPLNVQALIDFFASMGLVAVHLGPSSGAETVQLGLRLDVRENAKLARAIVKTVIHFGESKLEGGLVTPAARFEYTVQPFNAAAGDAPPIEGGGGRAARAVARLAANQQEVVEDSGDSSETCSECGTPFDEGPGCSACCGCNECACDHCNPDHERCGNHNCETCYPDGASEEAP